MSNNKDDGWWEDEGRPDKIETYNRGKKIYTDLYGDPVGQKIYEVITIINIWELLVMWEF